MRVALFILISAASALVIAVADARTLRLQFSRIAVSPGTVVRTDCPNHQGVFYRFRWKGREVTGSDFSPGPCEELIPGDRVAVWHSETRPELNRLDDPGPPVVGVICTIFVGMFFGAFISLSLYLRRRFR